MKRSHIMRGWKWTGYQQHWVHVHAADFGEVRVASVGYDPRNLVVLHAACEELLMLEETGRLLLWSHHSALDQVHREAAGRPRQVQAHVFQPCHRETLHEARQLQLVAAVVQITGGRQRPMPLHIARRPAHFHSVVPRPSRALQFGGERLLVFCVVHLQESSGRDRSGAAARSPRALRAAACART
jgi:hypothetical protein